MAKPSVTNEIDSRLLSAWRESKDQEAFRSLCERHAALVRSACLRLGSSDPDEAAQAVFIVLAQRSHAVADPDRLAGWLLGTTRRVVANQIRSSARRQRHEVAAAVTHGAYHGSTDGIWTEARPLLDEALARLSSSRREALVRFYLENKSHAEVAIELGCSPGAVKTRVHEGLEKLRDFFHRRGVMIGAAALASGLASESIACGPDFAIMCARAGLTPTDAPAATLHSLAIARPTYTAVTAGLSLVAIISAVAIALAWPKITRHWPDQSSRTNAREFQSARTNPQLPEVKAGSEGPTRVWQVSGPIEHGHIIFDTVFGEHEFDPVNADTGTGPYRMEVQAPDGKVLFVRHATSSTPERSSDPDDFSGERGPADERPRLFELLPIIAGAARIAVFSPANDVIGTMIVNGQKPNVTISPIIAAGAGGALCGEQTISWTIVDLDSKDHAVIVSCNSESDGESFRSVAGTHRMGETATSEVIDFDYVFSKSCSITVCVSDGVNWSTTTTPTFAIVRKNPFQIYMSNPTKNQVYTWDTDFFFDGYAFDEDEEIIPDSSIRWDSNVDGFLANGAGPQIGTLSHGIHVITMTATSKTGKQAQVSVTISVAP
jgi:RNA polymerase sigma factor (sigma-70 family)